MKSTSFNMKTALLATLILSGKAMAQSLPDEINHPQYLRIYENLEQVLVVKKAEFNNLSDRKAEIEKSISEMQRDQGDLPVRNAELERLINAKRAELSQVQIEISGLEGVLSRVIEDLRRIDAIISQLQRDISDESVRANQIQNRRAQVAQDVARINNQLQQELAEEQQSIRVLNNLNRGLDNDVTKRNEDVLERQNLTKDIERFKRELPSHRNKVTTNNQIVTTKKSQLAEAQGKLPGVRSKVATETAELATANAAMAPVKAKIAQLKSQLAAQTPEVTRLQKEISDLNAKIASNKSKITAFGLAGLISKRDNLEKELEGVRSQASSVAQQIVAAKEAIKPDLGQLNEVMSKMRELERAGSNPAEVERLKREASAIERRLLPKKAEITRLEKNYDNLLLSIAPKEQELTNTKNQISQAESAVAKLEAENAAATAKIAENQKVINTTLAANSGLVKEISDLEASIKSLEINRDRIAANLAQLKAQESSITAQVTSLTAEIKASEAESVRLTKIVTDMEKEVADFPLNSRRLENRIKVYDGQIQEAKLQIIRENKLLVRIQQNRSILERDSGVAQNELNRVNSDLAQSQQLISVLQNNLNKEVQNRDALTRYNQDSIRKYDSLKVQKSQAENTIAQASQEIGINNQDISTIGQELPRLRNELNVLTPKVVNAERLMFEAQKKSDDAGAQYQGRLSLFQTYLSDAQSLGISRASIGTLDGTKAGAIDGRLTAIKFATENAAAEAKWVAMRRGYIRGEIAGNDDGFQIGMNSSADASKGITEGRSAGAKRAKDYANLVLKPEFYETEFSRRLVEDEVSNKMNLNLALEIRNELKMMSLAGLVMRSNIPELTAQEIEASSRIISALDTMIEQSLVEANQAFSVRSRLADPRGVYTNAGAGENAANPNCSGVYKNVREFVDACKATYGDRYKGLYESAHQVAFVGEYGNAFADQIIKTFDAELERLYPSYLKEATAVGKEVGLAAGKKEIYSQSFSRAETESYNANISAEQSRVASEASVLVDSYLKESAALTLKGQAKLVAQGEYGISPGAQLEIKMLLKNAGSKVSNTSVIGITEVSSNINVASRDAALPAVGAKSQANLTVMQLQVSESARPGSKIVLAGQLVHPATHYSAGRVENFRIEEMVAVNLSVDSSVNMDTTPKVSTLGIVKKHNIDFTLSPKFEGVDSSYEVSIEEVGSSYARFSNKSVSSGRLARGESKKMTFEYKLDKSARGKRISFKVTVRNAGVEVKVSDLQISAE